MTIAVTALFVAETADKILAHGLNIARIVGLPVTSWRTGDPTRSLYLFVAESLETYELKVTEYILSGFRSTWTGDWATVAAKETYNVDRIEADHATPTATLTNGGGGFFEIESEGDLRVKNTSTGKTYHNTSLGTLGSGDTVTFELIADEAGSDSTTGVDEIDALVTTMGGVVIDSSTAAVASDEETPPELSERCGDTLGALSPDGPPDAYTYVATNSDLTGVTDVKRARSVGNNATGNVTLWLASSNGPVATASVTAVQSAIEQWATPLCITPTAQKGTQVTINTVGTVTGTVPSGFEATAKAAVDLYLSTLAISDGTDAITISKLSSVILVALPTATGVVLTTPTGDVALSQGFYAVPGTFSLVSV